MSTDQARKTMALMVDHREKASTTLEVRPFKRRLATTQAAA